MGLNSLSKDLLYQQPSAKAPRTLEPSGADKAIDALSKFIPTEMLAPFVAALSLIATGEVTWSGTTVYAWFLAATPAAFLLFHFAKIAMDKAQSWPTTADLPLLVWKALAATVAFAVWAVAVPTNELQTTVGGPAVAGFFAIIVSPLLTAIDAILVRVFQKPPSA